MQESVSAGTRRRARLKMLGYYGQRLCTSRRLRKLAARALVAGLRVRHGRAGLPAPDPDADADPTRALRTCGLQRIGQLLTEGQCADILAHLRDQDMHGKRGGAPFRIDSVPPGTGIGEYALDTLVNCPHLMDVANHPEVLRIATRYFGYTPVISLMGLRWSFPGDGQAAQLAYHRDAEPGCIKLMVYLNRVDRDGGPHGYLPGSHRDRMPLRLRHLSEDEARRRHGPPLEITGPAGSAFFIDTKGIHRGAPPTRGARLLLFVQYSLLPCLMYDYVPAPYRGSGRFSHYVNRLMLASAGARAAPWD